MKELDLPNQKNQWKRNTIIKAKLEEIKYNNLDRQAFQVVDNSMSNV